MGASQSKSQGEQAIQNDVPIQLSQEVVNHLANSTVSPLPSLERQNTIDSQIRSRIELELSKLRQEEENVRKEIELTLQKENLSYERGASTDKQDRVTDKSHTATHSAVLIGDLEELHQKVEKFHSNRSKCSTTQVAEELVSCYKANTGTSSLNCWADVAKFKSSVSQMEHDYIQSFR